MGSFSELISLERQKNQFPASAAPWPAFHAVSPVCCLYDWVMCATMTWLLRGGMIREFDNIFKDYLFYLCVHAWVYMSHVCAGACEGQKRASATDGTHSPLYFPSRHSQQLRAFFKHLWMWCFLYVVTSCWGPGSSLSSPWSTLRSVDTALCVLKAQPQVTERGFWCICVFSHPLSLSFTVSPTPLSGINLRVSAHKGSTLPLSCAPNPLYPIFN